MITLIVSYYQDKSAERQKEIDECFERNIYNKHIDKMIVLSECEFPFKSDKIEVVSFGRPNWNDFFSFTTDDINIICNSDIYFDDTLELAKKMPVNAVYALSRWDDGVLFDRWDSQDAWIFKGKSRVKDAPFTLGIGGTDNKIAYLFILAKYKVMNPAKTIKAHHIHRTNIRYYNDSQRLSPPFHLINPTTI